MPNIDPFTAETLADKPLKALHQSSDSPKTQQDATVPEPLSQDPDITSISDSCSTTKDIQTLNTLTGTCLQSRYMLEHQIGAGGMSNIYRAKDLSIAHSSEVDCHVAIKILHTNLKDCPDALSFLFHEAHKSRRLSHPNIIRVFDVNSCNGIHFMVMEYLDGDSLDQVIKRSQPKGIKLPGVIKILEQLTSALSYAHRAGIVHADLKPSNIMLNRDGSIKILDFGVAHQLHSYTAEASFPLGNSSEINSGYTPAYASPSILSGNPPSKQDDVYSLACICYELLTSRHPFRKVPTDERLTSSHAVSKPRHLGWLKWRALRHALSSTADRLNTVDDFMQAMSSNYWSSALKYSTVLILLCTASWFSYNQQQLIHQHSEQQDVANIQAAQLEMLSQASAEHFLDLLPDITDALTLQREGLIRIKRSSVLSLYESRIDAAFNERASMHPNYPYIESLLAQAEQLYPDSRALNLQSRVIAQAKQAAIRSLDEQIHLKLSSGDYEYSGEGQGLKQLIDTLNYIDPAHRPELSAVEIKQYKFHFNKAINGHNVSKLNNLIAVGSELLADNKEIQDLLVHGDSIRSSVATLSAYHEQQKEGAPAPFPYHAATTFYKGSFEDLNSRLRNNRSLAEVDAVFAELEGLRADLPADFPEILKLQKELASVYLSQAEILLKQHKVRTAERVMQRANKLLLLTSA